MKMKAVYGQLYQPTNCLGRVLFEAPVVAFLVKISPHFIECENLLPPAQEPAAGPISEPDETRLQLPELTKLV